MMFQIYNNIPVHAIIKQWGIAFIWKSNSLNIYFFYQICFLYKILLAVLQHLFVESEMICNTCLYLHM